MQFLASLSGKQDKLAPGGGSDDKCRYRCVEVHADHSDCCKAVRDIAGRRFLTEEIPEIPLDGCDARDCRCSFELLDDRRCGSRRASDASRRGPSDRTGHRSSRSSGRRRADPA